MSHDCCSSEAIMQLRMLYIAVLLLLRGLSSAYSESDDHGFNEDLQNAFTSIKNQTEITDYTNLTSWNMEGKGTKFNCESFAHTTATNVNELTPYDIQVVGAIGDSMTAAQGAKACTLLTDKINYRGVSWSIGGDEDLSTVTTLPNILRKYNPNLKGFSVKTGDATTKNARFDAAISGSIAQDMPHQAKDIVQKMKDDSSIDFENDWKVITLWIGGNNLCKYCKDKNKNSPENYVANIKEALDYFHDNLPRTFVNLVQIIDITRLAPLRGLVCDAVHFFVCTCYNDDETSLASTQYQEQLDKLISSGIYEKDDFTVVIQPFFEGVEIPLTKDNKPDKSYFAPDCFHFSTKGHMEGAKALWKNMFEPVGSKTSGWQVGGPLYCPTEDNKYLYTSKNSPPPDFNAQGPTSSNQNTEDDQHGGNQYVGIIAGTTVAAAVFVIIIIIVIAMIRYKIRHRSTSISTEKIPLINTKL